MNTPLSGKDCTPPGLLIYWIQERYEILIRKRLGHHKPWSDDPVFQKTYFCNVRREDDKVTKWIRDNYSQYVDDPLFEYNMVFTRFINWPNTLKEVGYMKAHTPKSLQELLIALSYRGKIWGNAYVITTHGMKMPKVQYLCQHVLSDVYNSLGGLTAACRGNGPTACATAAAALQAVDGIGTFLSAQVVADLKNTLGHPLYNAEDKQTFVSPGPGSLRGLSWFTWGQPDAVPVSEFFHWFPNVRKYVDEHWPDTVPPIDNQDLQNCLCEFDKFMRVRNGTGRSKRVYNGV